MPTLFNYSYVQTATGILEIDNIGQCAIKAQNQMGEEYYLVIRTSLGKVYTLNYGPIIPDLDILPPKVICNYESFDYKEKRLKLFISRWLEDPKKEISSAEIIEDKEVFDNCKDLIRWMREYRQQED